MIMEYSFVVYLIRFLMNLKLFIVMGISWLLEIFATLFDDKPMLWYVSDGFNLLQGVLVFFIFVFKRSVLVAFQKKLGKLKHHRENNRGSLIQYYLPFD